MYVRKKHNKSNSLSVQIIDKSSGVYRLIKTVGSSADPEQIDSLWRKAHAMLPELVGQTTFDFGNDNDKIIERFLNNLSSSQVRVVGPEMIFGKIFDAVGFASVGDELFRHLVITRLVYPGSKLKTIDYLRRYNGVEIDVSRIYRFLDKLSHQYKEQVQQIAFAYTKKTLRGRIHVVFYDMTTLYFEASDEDDLRKTGFSKDGKAQHPQILLGLLLGENGYPIGYEIFEGNTFEGHTLIPVLEHFQVKFDLSKPIVVADSALLSSSNLEQLKEKGYKFILGARIKNESKYIKQKILQLQLQDGQSAEIIKEDKSRLIISQSSKRSQKDAFNRKRGLNRLEKELQARRLTKSHINNRGYNKYLKLTGSIHVEIDYQKFEEDNQWDGLKGYITNCNLPAKDIIEDYNNLWQIEKAFRISKTDLKVRPIYHRIRHRIEAHICIAFVAYTIIKELERRLKLKNVPLSAKRVAELSQTIYAINASLPESNKNITVTLQMTDEQKLLHKILNF